MTFYIGVNKYQEKPIKLGGKIIVDLVREKFSFKKLSNSPSKK